jgi:formylglycine-generating enzyme required for sulfatase activity
MSLQFRAYIYFSVLFLLISSGFSQSVSISGGSFSMGRENGHDDEKPVHPVTLSPYEIDKAEITEAQYENCVKTGKCTPAHYDDGSCMVWIVNKFHYVKVPADRRDPENPVVCVTWFQAQEYCRAQGKRLPTEAQWEYAATGGNPYVYAWGNDAPSRKYCAQASGGKPDKVCSHGTYLNGLCDMTGNVWEWTSDNYSVDYYSYSPMVNPDGPIVGLYRVIRGGGWYSGAAHLVATNRFWFSPNFAEVSIGFRCVR